MPRERQISVRVDLRETLGVFSRTPADPTTRLEHGAWWRTMRTPAGPATLQIAKQGATIVARAWGPGADWALELAPAAVGANDSLEGFSPSGLVARLAERHRGLRIPRLGCVFQCSLLSILEQKVPGKEAWRAYHRLLAGLGEPAPGPRELLLPPDPARLAEMPYYDLHRFGIERRRAETLRAVARRAAKLEQASLLPLGKARQRLQLVPGIGPWTAAEIARIAFGDADAVSLGDYNYPALVAFNLAGERRADDARMLELLEPFAGHRGRVLRLLEVGGRAPPRRGPRRALRDFRTH